MSFASPIFLWGLVSLIPLVAIYFLKVRPTQKPTTAYFLWEQVFQEKRSSSLFQRLRDLFSMLLMLLAFAAVVMALTRPTFSSDQQRDLILLIDNSVSMNAKTGVSDRLEQAKQVAREIVQGLNGTQRCSVASVSTETRFFSNLTDNPRELLDAIDAIEPTYLPSETGALESFRPTLSMGKLDLSSTEDDSGPDDSDLLPRVILISDGCLRGEVPESIELIKIDQGDSGNVGIVACDLQRLTSGDNSASLFVQLASAYPEPVAGEILVYQGTEKNLVKLLPVEINPGVNLPDILEIDQAEPGQWTVEIELANGPDALDDDDQAFLALPDTKTPHSDWSWE